jgi:hypothetical protein
LKGPPDRCLADLIFASQLGHGLTSSIPLGNALALAKVKRCRPAELRALCLCSLDTDLTPHTRGVRVGLGADFTEKCYAAVTSAFQTRRGFPMKSLVVAAALATFTLSPASAQTTACTGENLAKMTDRVYAMPYGPKKMAATREIAIANAHASRGDIRGACAHYGAALSIESNASGHFEHLHFE